ncbi:MAG: HK97 gp10 family phage protein [Erysipelotrichaceae bacterium]|nr:HK97 gp10 family phage protein [Erysipelotrichaceae bacterium]
MSKLEGLDQLLKKMEFLSDFMTESKLPEILDRANKGIVQAAAKLECPVREIGGGGELRNSIKTSLERRDSKVIATTYTNKRYAAYVEFGTGPVGQENHDGVSPEFVPSYSQHGWGIPADEVDEADAERYGWQKRTYQGKDYYMTSGQPAHPFMYPALKNNEAKVATRVKSDLRKEIRKVTKK